MRTLGPTLTASILAAILWTPAPASCRPSGEALRPASSDPLAGAPGREGPGPREPGERPPPPTCSTDADCAGKCPPETKGCACHTNPRGEQRCAPTCQTDADCPTGKDGRGSCTDGICRPPKRPDRPRDRNRDRDQGR
jgi:hypothetical protein